MGEKSSAELDATGPLASPANDRSAEHTPATAVQTDPERTAHPDRLAVGTRVGRFAVLGELGAGGMGVVHAAYDPELDRRVAIKLLRYASGQSRESNLRFMREAQAMARLSHPNVVSVYDVGDLDGRAVFLAMEYIDGDTLDVWLAAKPREWREIRDVLIQAGRGLAAAHRRGLVHRDFKPKNVLIAADGRARVSDFGIARLDESDDAPIEQSSEPAAGVTPLSIPLTRTGAAVGTPAYMAPEQHKSQAVDARADQFAFCVSAWEAIYGARPFKADGNRSAEIEAGPTRPATTREVPPHVEATLRRGLAADPAARWPDLDVLLARLADDPALRRRQRIALGTALLAVAAIGGLATWAATGREQEEETCAAGDGEIAGTWNPMLRGNAEGAFRASGSLLAAEHWQRVATRIDAWTAQWKAARRDACQQHVAKAESDELYDRHMVCLTRQRNALVALVDVMRKPDPVVVRESVMAAAVLPPPSDCANTEVLLGQAPMPANPVIRAEVATYSAEIARIDMMRTLGRYAEALAAMQSLAKRAEHVDYPTLKAALGIGVGQLQSDTSDPATETTLRSAAEAAALARDQRLYARVWVMLVFEIGFQRARFDDAKPLRAFAWQAIHLAGDDPQLTVMLQSSEAAVDIVHGDKEVAAAEVERAIATIERKYGARSVDLVAPLNLLGVIRNLQQQTPKAVAAYERALAILGETVSPKHPRAASILGNLSGIAFDEGRFQEAIDLGRRSLAIMESALGPDSSDLGATLNTLALPLWALKKWDEAYALVDRARMLWEKQLGHVHPYVAVAFANLGGLRLAQGRCKEAIPLLEDARAIETKVLPPDHLNQVMTLTFLAGCFNESSRSAEAIPLAEQALKIAKQGKPLGLAAPNFELARALWATGKDRPRALALAEQARQVLDADPSDRAQRAAGVKSSSQEVAEWQKGKTTAGAPPSGRPTP